jgi:hypothetical protein
LVLVATGCLILLVSRAARKTGESLPFAALEWSVKHRRITPQNQARFFPGTRPPDTG